MNRRLLLVDDQPDFQEGVRQVLAPHYEITVARSGAEALACFERRGSFAAVVSDYAMPGMNGIELLATLAKGWPETTRILMTGRAELALALEALEHGSIFRFLIKPPEPTRLLEAVEDGVERFQVAAEERVFTEQLSFARDSLQTLNGVLESRLERELALLDRLAQGSDHIAEGSSLEDVYERTARTVRDVFGARAPEVRIDVVGGSLEIVPSPSMREHERRSLTILSNTARGAVAHSRGSVRVRHAQRTTLRALEEMARHRDDETGDHLARVSAYVRILALGLRETGRHLEILEDDFIEDLALAAPLHDIGKVAIPDGILFKPGKLDEREWEIMRTHATVGAEILRGAQAGQQDVELLDLAREIAWTHHERWDGTGYPRGLAREAIPLSGRIMAIADCYDALTSVRPYKPAWPHHAAAAYIQEQRGRAFDPDLVDVLLAHQDRFEEHLGEARIGA